MPTTGFYRVQAVFGLIYLCAGSAKLLGADIMVEAFDATGLGQSLRVGVGVLEICGGLCLFVPRASIYAAVVLGCTIVGILGAAIGHVVDHGDQRPFDAPRVTATTTRRADFHRPLFNASLWQVPPAIRPRGHIEG
jgi:uncharacterized membrane protein YphA (DoxX/SURF4 family)